MAEYTIKTNCRIEELSQEKQLALCRFINHMASMPWMYQSNVIQRLAVITQENPWQDDIPTFDKEEFLKFYPIDEDDYD